MATAVIVREKAEHYESPERATVNLSVELTGYDREYVHTQVSDVLKDVRADIEHMRDDQNGPITWHAISNANTWSWKYDDGVKFTERIEVKAKFSDFAKLGEWLNTLLTREGVRLSYIDWTLTEQRKKELELQLRQKAVQLAREKAEQYAGATGLHISAVKTIADVGLLNNGRTNEYANSLALPLRAAAKIGAAPGATDSYNFTPEDVLISASIEAEFLAE